MPNNGIYFSTEREKHWRLLEISERKPIVSRNSFAIVHVNLMNVIFIRLEAKLQPNIGFTLRGNLTVFTRLIITSPKVNRFGRNLEHSKYIVGSRPWQILGAIRADSDSLRGRRNFFAH